MGGFSVGGIASGLDTKALVEQLMSIEQQPLRLLQQKKSALNTKNQVFQTINTRILALKGAASELTMDLNLRAKSATSSDTNVLTAKAGADAASGSYRINVKQLATATTLRSGAGLGTALSDASTVLSEIKGSAPIKAGTFTIQWTRDSDGSTQTNTVTVDPTKSLSDVFAGISTQTGGDVTAALVGNKIELTAANATKIILGAGSDTSNFLSVTNLRTVTYDGPIGATIRSTSGISTLQVNTPLATSNLVAGAPSSGAFKINGVELSYNAATESLNDILTKINASKAGVTATYNPLEDKIVMTSRTTGSSAVSVEDTTGDLMSKLGLLNGELKAGQNAQIGIVGVNGFTGAAGDTDATHFISSATNTFTNVIPGLTFTAVKIQENTNDAITVTTAADPGATITKVKSFVDQYNQLVDAITDATAKGQPNAFDRDLRQITDSIRSMLASNVSGVTDSPKSLVELGLATSKDDKIHLQLDETKFKAAMEANPDRVAMLFQLTETDPLDSTKKIDKGIAAKLKTYLTKVGSTDGVFKTRDKSVQRQLRGYDDQITNVTSRLALTRKGMERQFAAMEQAVARINSQKSAFLSQISALG
ncbi:MAG TPA: flagellar filament capping protein FliD [Pantanalinema sp.]